MANHFWLLIKKNLIVEFRLYIKKILEILIIVAIFTMTMVIGRLKSQENSSQTTFYRNIILDDLSQFKSLMDITSRTIPYKLYFTPNNEQSKNIIESCVKKLNLSGSLGFDSENEMVKDLNPSTVMAGIVFKGPDVFLRFPNYFRTKHKKKSLKMQDFWLTHCSGVLDFYEHNNMAHVDFYAREGFLQLLYALLRTQNHELMKEDVVSDIISLFHNQEPKMACAKRRVLNSESFLNWSLYSFLYFMPFLNLLWKLAREHENNVFAHNWLYDLNYGTQRFAHFIVSLLHFLLLDMIVLLFFILIWKPLHHLQILFMLSFLVVYNLLLIVYAMALSTLLANGKTALWCGATLWIASYAVFSEILINMSLVLEFKTIITCLVFFNNLMPSGLFHIREKNLSFTAMVELFGVQVLILFSYMSLLQCFDYCKPGRYIKPLSFRGINRSNVKKDCWVESKNIKFQNNMEYGPLNGNVLELKNISTICHEPLKKDGQLKNISIKFFKNEISVITGPHGSGKTTLITILAGWQNYQGHIRLYKDNEVIESWSNYRQFIDVAMPNNALYDELTVEETLKYFIALKQPQENEVQMEFELDKWLNILRPTISDCQTCIKNLNFEQKRLLSLCCTLTCNTLVVLLDEPTLHMKAEQQYIYWEILKREKQDRAIIVTTMSIDEANEIGDRIGILYNGQLMAWGTPFYLRTKFGLGFYLICFIQPSKPIEPITQLLEKYITNIKVHQKFNDRVIYILPSDKKDIFQRLLIALEKDFLKLGINNIYMTGSHLNDVYMRLTRELGAKANLPDIQNTLKFLQEKRPKTTKCPDQALLYKKLIYQAKNSLPVLAIFIAIFLIFVFEQMSVDSLDTDRIVFASQMQSIPAEKTNMEIVQVKDLKSGLFLYKDIEYGSDSYEKRAVWNHNIVSAVEIKHPNISLWFNEQIFHAAPLAMHLAFKYKGYEGTIINKPIILITNRNLHITLGIIMPLTMSMVFVSLNEERFNHMMTLQRIAGLRDMQFWVTTFIWDYTIYLLISLLYLILIIADSFRWHKMMAAYFLFICGMLSLIFIYLMTLLLNDTSKLRAFFKIFLIQLMIGIFPYVLYINIFQNFAENIFYILMFSPGFAILHGTSKVFNNNEEISLFSYWQWSYPGYLDSICFLTIDALILLVIFLVIFISRKKYLQSIPKKVRNFASICYPYDDQRVVKERVRISNMNIRACRAQTILVDQLENELPKTGNRIKAISFALNGHSCFGIYGSHHSGKSHLIKQLIGEIGFWFGEVYIAGFSCKQQMSKAAKHVGYCPQDKGFNPLLTPREIFQYFLMISGVTKVKSLHILRDISITLKLRNYMNTRIEYLPENIKRRINVAIALIAHNEILLFDEPTRGLPAYERQLIWSIMKYCRSLGNTIVFTSSDTLEIKELADEIIVINEGEMLAYDNPHSIEYQYNVGFYLEIRIYYDGLTLEEVEENLSTDIENLNRFIMLFHSETELIYRSGSVVKYYVPVENVVYSYVFGSMEKNRNRLNIAEYTLTPILLTNALRLMQKYRKEKKRHERTRASLLKDAKVLPRRD